jgi:uncharacterized Zn finger protein (UPF0148 family)
MTEIQQFCPYCNQPLKKVGDKWLCPIHGFVLKEEEKEESDNKETPSYIN